MERERWLAEWSERLLECPHHHVIFTLPHDLIPLWRYSKREFPNVPFRAAIDSLRKLLDDPQYLGATPGLLAGLHTWGQTLIEHPHLHVIVSAGGLTEAGQWVEPEELPAAAAGC